MTLAEWRNQYNEHMTRARRIHQMYRKRMARIALDAGIDPAILEIHVNNALVAYEQHGKQWPGVDYSKVRLLRRMIRDQWKPYRLVDQWSSKYYPACIGH